MPDHRSSILSLLLLVLLFSLLSPSTSQQQQQQQDSTPITHFQQYLRINTAPPKPQLRRRRHLPQNSSSIHQKPTPPNQNPLSRDSKQTPPPNYPPRLQPLPSISTPSPPNPSSGPTHLSPPPLTPSPATSSPAAPRTISPSPFITSVAIRNLGPTFQPVRAIHISYLPEEEIGGFDGMTKFVESDEFRRLNVGFMLDEGQASISNEYRVFYADRSPWNVVIKAVGMPGHGSKLFDNSAVENLMKSVEVISKFREIQFDLVKAGLAANSEVISANPVYVKAGTPSPNGFVMNMQPSEAEAGVDVRLPPTVDPDLLMKRIADEWAPANRNMTFEIVKKGREETIWGGL